MKPMQRKSKKITGDCFNCENCMYHSEGDSFCDVNNEFVLEDWIPTENFRWCDGKHWSEN